MSSAQAVTLVTLMAEDNAPDVALFREALIDSGISLDLHVVSEGDNVLRFLRKQPPFTDVPRPDVVLLDINLPVKNGREILAEMASDPALNTIPVAVLTTSAYDSDILDMYPTQRCQYFVKTGDFNELIGIIKKINDFVISARADIDTFR